MKLKRFALLKPFKVHFIQQRLHFHSSIPQSSNPLCTYYCFEVIFLENSNMHLCVVTSNQIFPSKFSKIRSKRGVFSKSWSKFSNFLKIFQTIKRSFTPKLKLDIVLNVHGVSREKEIEGQK